MKIFFFVQVRMGASRLPGKPLLKVSDDRTLIESIYERIARAKAFRADRLFFLTSDQPSDDSLAAFFQNKGWNYLRGDEKLVFNRFELACQKLEPDYFFRICADNPFLEPDLIDELSEAVENDVDYISHLAADGKPAIQTHYGFFAELVSGNAFLALDKTILTPYMLEHVTPVFYQNSERFKISYLPFPNDLVNPDIRLTIDTPGDLDIVKKIFAYLPNNFNIYDVYRVCTREPDLVARMAEHIRRNRK